MSTRPQTLKDLRADLAAIFAVHPRNFSISGTCGDRRKWGYHLGESDIFGACGMGRRDYSLAFRRDRRGLTEASAGFDIRLRQPILRKLAAYLVTEATAGRTRLYREVIGPNLAGEATRWARENAWQPEPARQDHEWHIHLGFYRDTEFTDKRELFRAFARTLGILPPPAPEPPDEPLEPAPGEPPPPPAPEPPAVDPVAVKLAEAEETLRAIADLAGSY